MSSAVASNEGTRDRQREMFCRGHPGSFRAAALLRERAWLRSCAHTITVRWWSAEEDERVPEHEEQRMIASPDEQVVIQYEAPR